MKKSTSRTRSLARWRGLAIAAMFGMVMACACLAVAVMRPRGSEPADVTYEVTREVTRDITREATVIVTATPPPQTSPAGSSPIGEGELSEGMRRGMFYDLVVEQDALGVEGAERAYEVVAEKWGVSVEVVRGAAAAGVTENWAMPTVGP